MRKYILILLLIVSACGSPSLNVTTNPEKPEQTSLPTPQIAKDTIRWSLEGSTDLLSLDPSEPVNTSSNTVIGMIFGGLVRVDDHLEVKPDGAERWEVSDDGTVYTFHIRPDLVFADGTPVTAQDFVYSINRALDPSTASYGAPFHLGQIVGADAVIEGKTNEISGIRAIDAKTLEIKLLNPQAHFISQLAYSYTFVVPQSLVESTDNWQARAFGTGPYTVQSWVPGEQIMLTANPNYWQGELQIKQLVFQFYPDSNTALDDYLAGNLDIMGGPQTPIPVNRLAEVQDLADFRTSASLVTRYIGFNHTMAPFSDLHMRQALALATDRTALVEKILPGAAEPAKRILPTGLLGSELPIRPLEVDNNLARQTLAQSKIDLTSTPLELSYAIEGDNQHVAEALTSMWQSNLGINIQAKGYDLETFVKLLDTTYYTPSEGLQLYLSVWGADYPDPQNFISQQLHTTSPNNNGHFSNPEFDTLVEQADLLGKAEELDKRLQMYNFAEQIAIDEVAWLPLFYPTFNTMIRPEIDGLVVTPIGIVIPDRTQLQRQE